VVRASGLARSDWIVIVAVQDRAGFGALNRQA
jgi:hypothetical protein